MGQIPNPLVDDVKLREFFPSYHRTRPIVSIKKPINLEYVNTIFRVFRSAASPKRNEDYIFWLNKIETKKGQTWKDGRIYDLV